MCVQDKQCSSAQITDNIQYNNIVVVTLLTHSSSPGSAGFPSGCCRLKLWPSGHCRSESLARNQTGEVSTCDRLCCRLLQVLLCYWLCLFSVVYSVVSLAKAILMPAILPDSNNSYMYKSRTIIKHHVYK